MNIALFDLDGSLADFDKAMARDLRLIASPIELIDINFNNFCILENFPHWKARIELIKNQPGWWFNLEEINAGFAVLEAAKQIGFECQILTKGPSLHTAAWKEKIEWCQIYVPGHSIDIVGKSKGRTYGKILYDDYPKYMLEWLEYRPRGLGIMPVYDNNKDFEHPQVIRYYKDNLDEVIAAMKTQYERE